MSFFNTIGLTGNKLRKAVEQCQTQNEIILEIFRIKKELTPVECHKIFEKSTGTSTPLTSIRRGITQLTSRGNLIKTELKRNGLYGVENYVWRVSL